MNTKNYVLILVFSCLLLGCGKPETVNNLVIDNYRVTNVLYAKDSKLKRVYQCSDKNKTLYSEYKYDELGNISRIDYGNKNYGYEIYLYNAQGQLEKISNYQGTHPF